MTFRGLIRFVVVVALVGGGAFIWYRAEGDPPALQGPDRLRVGGRPVPLELRASDARSGLREIRISIATADREFAIARRSYPGSLGIGGASAGVEEALTIDVDAGGLGLPEGEATLIASARDWSWRDGFLGNEARLEIPLRVDLSPPRVRVASGLTYVTRGGSGLVVYELAEPVARDGVSVADVFFRGFPAPGADAASGRRVALFAVPTDAPADPPIAVVAEDGAGNVGHGSWPVVLKERALPSDDIRLSQRFLETKVRELAGATGVATDDLERAFDEINTRIRAANEARIREIVHDTAEQPLWDGPFEQMANSKVTSRFAEKRSYYVDGRKISQATHFGYDLASTSGAPIDASNSGRVAHAGDLGIYGNCVILDHGLGLFSLYAHLSRIDVSPGDSVAKGQTLGISGATGLAGGDHLHFAILVGDAYVEPLEWWDPAWVRKKIDSQLSR